MTTTLLVVDTETGGLDPVEACIIEIAARVLIIEEGDVSKGESFTMKIKPDRPVHPKAAAVNGYKPADWAHAREPQEALRLFRGFVQEQCNLAASRPMWTGCNPLFDLKFYTSDRKRHDEAEPTGLHYRVVDVASMALPLLFSGAVHSVALRHLRAWAGCEGEQSHTAMGDVEDTCEVIGALLLEYGS